MIGLRSKDVAMTSTTATSRQLRIEVRELLASYEFEPSCDAWMRKPDPAFSRELGRRGWIGMTLPPPVRGRGAVVR